MNSVTYIVKKNSKAVFISVTFFVSSFLFTNTLLANKTVGTLKVGVVIPLSGPSSKFGLEIKDGLELATENFQKRQKTSNVAIELLFKDNRSDINLTSKLASELVKENRVAILMGGLSSPESDAIAEVASKEKRLFLSVYANHIRNFEKSAYIFKLNTSEYILARALGEYLSLSKSLPNKIGIVMDGEDLPKSTELKSNFIQGTSNKKMQIFNLVLKDPPPPEKIETSDALNPNDSESENPSIDQAEQNTSPGDSTEVRNTQEELSPFTVDPLAKYRILADEIQEKKLDTLFFTTSWFESEKMLLELVADDFQGRVLGLEYWNSQRALTYFSATPKVQAEFISHYRTDLLPPLFIKMFREKHKRIPSPLAAIAYEGGVLITQTYENAKSVRIPPLYAALKDISIKDDVFGPLKMTEEKSLQRPLIITKPRPGGAVTSATYIGSDLKRIKK